MNRIIIGDTTGFTFSIVYPESVAGTPAPDLSDATVKFMIKKNVNDPDYKAVFVQAIDKPSSNIVYFEMNPSETSKLVQGTYKAACKLFYDGGAEKTVWLGDVIAVKGVFSD